MDPEVIAAREKHKLPKQAPSMDKTLFQQQLAKNPYALALATPVRCCQLTSTRLPKYFLQDFELMAHPDSREPWWVPLGLRKKSQDVRAELERENANLHLQSEAEKFDGDMEDSIAATEPLSAVDELGVTNEALQSFDSSAGDTASHSSTTRPRPLHSKTFGPGVYTLSRKTVLLAMQKPRSGWTFSGTNFPASSNISEMGRKVRSHASWRNDMDTFVLELHRRRIVERLIYVVQRRSGYVAGCVDWNDAQMAGKQQGAILWTGNKDLGEQKEPASDESAVDGEAEARAEAECEDDFNPQYPGRDEPPPFATLTIGKIKPRMVPVHNLQTLLGATHVENLRKTCPIFLKELVLLKDKKTTVDLQMRLWKLQGYLAFPDPTYGVPEKGKQTKPSGDSKTPNLHKHVSLDTMPQE